MRNVLVGLFSIMLISSFAACSDDATRPAPTRDNRTIQGEIGDADFEFEIGGEPGDPLVGPFLLRGTNLHYDDSAGALVVDLTVRNLGGYPQREPVGLTFVQLDPDEVTLLNPDNDIHGDGAAIVFHFANDDGIWTPDEASLPRTVQFGVPKGVSIAFVARLDLGEPILGGAIAGRVWNDGNRNGIMEDGEPGIPGVAVYMGPFADDDSTVTREFFQTITDYDGRYVFGPLRAGGYVVNVGPSTIGFFPTTPTEIRVLLVEINGEVSSYRNANFGGVPYVNPPPFQIGERVHVTGNFFPDVFLATFIERVLCPDDTIPIPLDVVPDFDCVGGRLRGPVTALAPERGAFKLMNTWIVNEAMSIPPNVVVGSRLDVHVHRMPEPGTPWILDSIAKWDGPHEELQGRIDAVDVRPEGVLRIFLLDTWVNVPTVGVGPR